MDSDRFQRIMQVFELACGVDAGVRTAFLDRQCGGDLELRRQVEAMLHADARPAAPVESAAGVRLFLEPSRISGFAEAPVPILTGDYRIIRVIGQGGMGTVYEAEQARPRRTVALKVIRSGLTSRHALKRFAHEAQVLGRLHHPGIAQIFEAGAADPEHGDQAFFVMEYVRGKPLTEYAHQLRLGLPARIELIIKICDAVQHAHQKGVIHRDLKPANILVEEGSGIREQGSGIGGTGSKPVPCSLIPVPHSAQPKILDFGVALSDPDPHETSMHTAAGQLIGTLPYMSPEQIGGDPDEVDARSDIYALGVVLYESLTGRIPYDLAGKSLPERARLIREENPLPARVANPSLRGDLETIIAKAMDKDPARRYPSASDLGADLRRYLNHEPITARPATLLYHAARFARRHRALVATAAALVLALVGGIVVATWEATHIVHQQRRAERAEAQAVQEARAARREAEVASKMNEFLRIMLGSVSPLSLGQEVTMRQVLDQTASCVDSSLADDPEVAAAVHGTLGNTYRHLGLLDAAEAHVRAALDLRRRISIEPAALATSIHSLSMLLCTKGDYAGAIDFGREALAIRRQCLDADHVDTASTLNDLAVALFQSGQEAEAIEDFKEALAMRRRLRGSEDGDVAQSMLNLGQMLNLTGDYAAAKPVLTEALALERRLHGREHPLVATALTYLAALDRNTGDDAAARALLEEALAIQRKQQGPEHPAVAKTMTALAEALDATGEPLAAESLGREAIAIQQKVLPPNHPALADSWYILATLLIKLGGQASVEQSEAALRQCLDIRTQSLGAGHWQTACARSALGSCLTKLGRFAEAEPLVLESYPTIKNARGPAHRQTIAARQRVMDWYQATGQPEKAAGVLADSQ